MVIWERLVLLVLACVFNVCVVRWGAGMCGRWDDLSLGVSWVLVEWLCMWWALTLLD